MTMNWKRDDRGIPRIETQHMKHQWNHFVVLMKVLDISDIRIQCMHGICVSALLPKCRLYKGNIPFIDAMGTQLLLSTPLAVSKIPSVSYATIAGWKKEKLEEGWNSTLSTLLPSLLCGVRLALLSFVASACSCFQQNFRIFHYFMMEMDASILKWHIFFWPGKKEVTHLPAAEVLACSQQCCQLSRAAMDLHGHTLSACWYVCLLKQSFCWWNVDRWIVFKRSSLGS